MSKVKNNSIFALSLGSKLAIVNGNFWIIFILLARDGSLDRVPEPFAVSLNVVMLFMALPIGCLAVIPASGGMNTGGIIVVAVCLGLNSLVWGHSLAWIFKRLAIHFRKPRKSDFPSQDN
jgi:threonine/homoserine efflux transporter RhtA